MAKKTDKTTLQAEKRTTTGRKVKKLRQEGLLPANIYGKKVKSLAVQVDLKSFSPIYKETGETGLVELKVKGETKARPVLIHNVQLNPVDDQPIHADFYQVDLKEKVTTEVPIELIGESPAVKEKIGILIQPLTEVEIEALPAELPDKFEVNLGELKKVGDAVTVDGLKVPTGVKVLTDVKQILAKIEPPAEEEAAPPVVEEAPAKAAAEEEKPTEEVEEKKPPEEGKAPPEGGKPAKEKVEKKEENQ